MKNTFGDIQINLAAITTAEMNLPLVFVISGDGADDDFAWPGRR
jgi:hypothetical protein